MKWMVKHYWETQREVCANRKDYHALGGKDTIMKMTFLPRFICECNVSPLITQTGFFILLGKWKNNQGNSEVGGSSKKQDTPQVLRCIIYTLQDGWSLRRRWVKEASHKDTYSLSPLLWKCRIKSSRERGVGGVRRELSMVMSFFLLWKLAMVMVALSVDTLKTTELNPCNGLMAGKLSQ
jgi:hypothetical protein